MICLYLGHSVAPNPYNRVASLVLHAPLEAGIGRKVSGSHSLSPKFSVNQHRRRENSYVFQVGGVLLYRSSFEAFLEVKECVGVMICQWYRKDCRECMLSSKINIIYGSGCMTVSVRRVY